jgi:hypothetical protein
MAPGLCQQLHGAVRSAARLAVVVVRCRPVRWIVGPVAVVLTIRGVVGVWPAALAGAVMVTAGVMAALAAIDSRPTEQRSPVHVPVRPAAATPRQTGQDGGLQGRHLEFARGLAGVAEWYLAECEREVQQ